MSNNYIIKAVFLFLCNISFLIFSSQLNSFYEDWQPKVFNFPENTILQNEPSTSSNVSINFNISNILGDVLPSHFGTNLTHFLGESVLNQVDFMNNIKGLNRFTFRYPGGNGSNQFFWDGNIPSSILNDSQITVNDLIDGSGWRISPDDFVQILDSVNGKGIIAVNASYARYGNSANPIQTAASYAASFVRHMNQNLGANIKYWEVGNENYGSWQAGYVVDGDTINGTKYGDIFNVFADSMKAADPTIKIGAVLFPHDGVYNNWSKQVLQKVQNTADFLIIHDYFRRKPNPNNVTYQEMLNSISEVQQNVSNVNNMVTNYTSKPSGYFPIAMTEFNSKTGEREISMANAIFISQVLCEQIKNNIGMSLLWSFQNGLDSHGGDHGMTARNSTIVQNNTPRPVYYVYYYINKFLGDKLVFSYSNDPDINCYVSTFSSGEIGMVVINTSQVNKTIEFSSTSSFTKDNFYWYEINALDETDKKIYVNELTTANQEGGPDFNNVPAFYRPVNGNYKFIIKPYSVNFIANSNDLTSTENTRNLEIEVYPNPFNEFININQQYDYLKLFDISGNLVFKSIDKNFDTRFLKEGIYILKLYKSNLSSEVKVIKIKK
jgi:hypothetical protein